MKMNSAALVLFTLSCIFGACLCKPLNKSQFTGNITENTTGNSTIKPKIFGLGGSGSGGLYESLLQVQLLSQLGSGPGQNQSQTQTQGQLSSICLLLLSNLLSSNTGGGQQGNLGILSLLPYLIGGNGIDISTLLQYGFSNFGQNGQYNSLQNILHVIQFCGPSASTSNLPSLPPQLLFQLLSSQNNNGNSNYCNLPCCTASSLYQCRQCGPGFDSCYNQFGSSQNSLSGFQSKPSGSNNIPNFGK